MGQKVDGALKSLIQGVSQQAPIDRIPGQAELQENMSNDPEKGLLRRPPTTFLAHLFVDSNTYQYYNMEIDGVTYVVASRPGVIRVFSIDGTEQNVIMQDSAADYITSTSLSFLTLEDVTYLANPEIVPVMAEDVKEYVQNSGIVFWLGGQYGRTYTVTIKANETEYTVSHTTPDGSESEHGAQIATTYIATKVAAALETELGSSFVVTRKSDVILITWADGETQYPLDITVDDGDGGANIFSVTDSVGDVGRLPRFAPANYVVKVSGVDNDYADDWYLQFTQETEGFGNEGLWVETVAPDIPYHIDPATMPHTITKSGSDFIVAPGDWQDRRVGDEYTNERPSFIGNAIQDMAAFQGRLVFLAGPNVIMSRTNTYDEFWMQSATTINDSDPIDISSAATRSTPTMRRAIPHNRDLVIFSDKAQFIVFGRNALTPSNTSLVLTTSYEAELNATPVPSGKNVFYAINYGRFTGIKEFYTEGDADINASRPITSHCTQYIEGKIKAMSASTNFDILLCQTETSARTLYVYEFVWLNNEKAQSAWSKWIFPWDVLHTFFVENVIYFIRRVGTRVSIEKMELDRTDDTPYYQTHLDSRVYIDGVNKVMTKPYTADDILYVQGEGCPNPGLLAKVESETDAEVVFHRDMEGGRVIMGRKYMSRFRPTRPILRDKDDVPVGTGILTVLCFSVTYMKTGAFDTVVTSKWYDDVVTHFSGRVLNSIENLVGEPAIATGTFIIPFMHDVTHADLEFQCDYATPMRLLRIEWCGDYIKKGTRI